MFGKTAEQKGSLLLNDKNKAALRRRVVIVVLKPRKVQLDKLDPKAYLQLCRQVLQRDGWRCQHCGGRTNLHVHHIQLRSQLGDDAKENLMTLCSDCHDQIHCG